MNNIQDLAKKMWDNLPFNSSNSEISKTHYCLRNYRHIDYQLLTDEEIENIFYNEVIVKWYVDKYGKVEFESDNEIKVTYIKEHTKELPTVQVIEMFDEVDGSKTFITKEDLEKIAAQPQSVDNTINWDEVQKEYHKLYSVKSMSGLDILTIPQRHLFNWLKQHYSLIKK